MARHDPFASFVWAGFECTYALNEVPQRLDLLASTRHDTYCRDDYRMCREVGIGTVREGLSWSRIDRGEGEYDFSRFIPMMASAQEENIQQIWDLNHFDFPEYLDPFSDAFPGAFAEYARRAITLIRKYQSGTIVVSPINEISFFAWIAADQGKWAPYGRGAVHGFAFKRQLVRASLAAMDAMRHEDHDVLFLHPDPFMRRLAVKPANRTAVNHADRFNSVIRFEAWDMLSGRTFPELGGNPDYLDIVGINYYFHNQESVLSRGVRGISHQAMDWDSPERIPFWEMIRSVATRYGKPVAVSETGSYGELRADWWRRTLTEIDEGLEQGIDIRGVCAYPTVDRPDSVNYLLRRSGLWDFADDDPEYLRIPHRESIRTVSAFARKWNG